MKFLSPILYALVLITVAITFTKFAVASEQKLGTEPPDVNERLGEGLSAEQAAVIDELPHVDINPKDIVMPDGQLLSDVIAKHPEWLEGLYLKPQSDDVKEGLNAEQAEAFDAAVVPHLEADQIRLPDGQILSDFIAENEEWFDYVNRPLTENESVNEQLEERLSAEQAAVIDELPHLDMEPEEIVLEDGTTLADALHEHPEWFEGLPRSKSKK